MTRYHALTCLPRELIGPAASRFVLCLLVAACASGGQAAPTLTFAPQLGIRLEEMTRLPSGLYLRDEVAGSGAVAERNASITVEYTGWLADGRQFDTSGGVPLRLDRLGRGQVIRGWDEGLLGMRAGGRRLLVVPPNLGYGADGQGAIPPHATLVFRIDLRTVSSR